jgi:hypothetical protein
MQKHIFMIIILIALWFGMTSIPVAAAASTKAADDTPVLFDPLFSHIGGLFADAVVVEGNYAYSALGPDLAILDIANPHHPTLLGSLYISGTYTVEDIEKRGNHLFAVGRGGLYIINIAELNNPILLNSDALSESGHALSLALSGNYAYIGYQDGLRVVDLSDPSHPIEIGSYRDIVGVYDVAVVGNYAYLALTAGGTTANGLAILDISTPTAPALVTLPTLQIGALGVAIAGHYAYMAQHGLHIVDISDPYHPTEVGYCACHEAEDVDTNITIHGQYAYLSSPDHGLFIIDVADPTHPVQVSVYVPSSSSFKFRVWNATIVGNYAYITLNNPAGFEIIDIATPTAPVKVGDYQVPGQAWDVAVFNNLAYVVDEVGLSVVDLSNPAKLTQIGRYAINGPVWGIAVDGQYAYIAGDENGLWIINVSDPTQPVETSHLKITGSAYHVTVIAPYAYVADQRGGVHIVEITTPATPTEIGLIDVGQGRGAVDVTVVGRYAYVACVGNRSAMQIVDISDPTHPINQGEYPATVPIRDIAVIGQYAYLAAFGGKSLRILDVSDPMKPVVVGTGVTPSVEAHSVDVSGHYAYVADLNGISIFDVSDPAATQRSAYFHTNSSGYSVAVEGNYAYVVGEKSLYSLRTLQEIVTTTIASAGGMLSANKSKVNVTFPSGAFTKTTTVTYKHLLEDENTNDLLGVSATFQLTALAADTEQIMPLTPNATYTVTVRYTDTQSLPIIENTLALYYRNDQQWVKAPTSVLDMSNKVIAASSSKLTSWAVLGETRRVYLPVILHK